MNGRWPCVDAERGGLSGQRGYASALPGPIREDGLRPRSASAPKFALPPVPVIIRYDEPERFH